MATPTMDHYPTPSNKPGNWDKEYLEKDKRKGNMGNKIIFTLLFLITVGLVAGLAYLYMQYRDTQDELENLKDPSNYTQLQSSIANTTIEKLSKLIILPSGEKPTMYTVVKADELKKTNQSFYKDVKNGDQIIIYSDKLIIFREKDNIIVNVSYFPAGSLEESASGQQKNTDSESDTVTNIDSQTDTDNVVDNTENN